MKPAPFAYHAPTCTEDAVALLAEHGDQARLLAGGQTLMPLMASRKVRGGHLIDLNRVPELSFVSRTDRLRIGALTRLRQLENDPVVRTAAPLLSRATALAGPVQVRNRATVGGALAYADPAAELPAVAVALGARVELRGSGVRSVPAEDFFLGAHQTALSGAEVLAAVEFPPSDSACAIEKIFPRPGLALAGAVAVLGGDTCRLVLFGVAPTPVRPAAAEAALARGAPPDEVADAAMAGLDPHGTGTASRHVLARGAVARVVATVRNEVTHG
ncbi:FAD binding domain-containing protein [Nonomuraea sp. bgisy101]|uniref:FAD binding domain-containing protein n=1 Tax=Nonomuraea sp. bgisy101 TaxID=3413784 RepID=UPI003D709CB8